jgi:hypothetical protein
MPTPTSVIDSWNRTAAELITSTQKALLHDLLIMLSAVATLDPAEGIKVAAWSLKVLTALMKIELEQKTEDEVAPNGI